MNFIKIFFILLLSGCSSSPEKPDAAPVIINAKIAVSAQVNPDINNRPSPIVVRIFELSSLGQYTESDFYDLFQNYESILGKDLLGSEQFHLNPGDIKILKLSVSPETKFIAVIAAYRDINRAIWKDAIKISTKELTPSLVFIDKLSISVWKK